jgi:hypothetical protein
LMRLGVNALLTSFRSRVHRGIGKDQSRARPNAAFRASRNADPGATLENRSWSRRIAVTSA